jgi:hypothetical protein
MRIGELRRTIIVEPLELPVSDPRDDSRPQPVTPKPELAPKPRQVPAT